EPTYPTTPTYPAIRREPPASSAGARVADHELGLEDHLARCERGVVGLFEQDSERRLSDEAARLAHRAERHDRGGCEVDVVESDERDVVRHAHRAVHHERLEQT